MASCRVLKFRHNKAGNIQRLFWIGFPSSCKRKWSPGQGEAAQSKGNFEARDCLSLEVLGTSQVPSNTLYDSKMSPSFIKRLLLSPSFSNALRIMRRSKCIYNCVSKITCSLIIRMSSDIHQAYTVHFPLQKNSPNSEFM